MSSFAAGNIARLSSTEHKQLRIITTRGAAYGDAMMSAITFPEEFRSLQAIYPIVFAPNQDGTSFDALALFGFERGENLFLGTDGWDAPALPLSVERIPFLIGEHQGQPLMHIDLDSPRVSTTDGQALFLTYGGTSEYMEHMTSVLRTLHDGLGAARGFFAALQSLELIEPFTMDIELDDGSEHRLAGYFTINEDRLHALPGAALERLAQAGYLAPVYLAIASLSQFRGLIARRNRRQAAGRQEG
ncbi:MAG: SapC family protein [Duganella sp.]